MANTYTLIESQVLGSSAASVTFSAIPSTYTDLVVRISAKSDISGTGARNTYVEFNGNTSAIYSDTELLTTWDGSANIAVSYAWTGDTFLRNRYTTATASPANTFNNYELYIPSYTVSQNKPMSVFGVVEQNSSQIAGVAAHAGLFRSTAAISSIKFSPESGNYVSGSSFYLYGIKNS
jgi:hypothetical protein